MQKNEKSKLTAIGKNKIFRSIITKLILQEELSEREKIYILTCAILFLKVYQADMRLISYADFAYSIILRYSLTSGDYRPLYDFSVNFGFYPITEAILKQNLVEQNIEDSFIRSELESFRHQSGYIETFHQSDQRKKFMDDKAHEKAYIAPTSFGKSSIIADYIKIHGDRKQKIAIIVPSKSLLVQTYNDLKQEGLKKRILIHNEMYNGEDSFIAVFTQERALRLLNRNRNAYFDILIIDEAHNLLKGADERSLLLARLINFNKQRNHLQEVIYLSPLIQKAESLRVSEGQQISKYLIGFNVKEPELFEYTTEGKKFVYNRFINQFYEIGESKNKIEYIKENSGEKTFIYVTSPPRIEEFALELTNNCPKIEASERIEELKRIISKEVHEDFYILESLDAGIIYLHGMLPDLLKEYLEYKFKQIPEIKYVIANMVILEGINLPIDTLFICHFYLLHGKRLMNLIGRVNRLNEIFNKNHVNLRKLIPNIHIVNNRSYTDVHNPKFKELRSRIFADEISNPVLSSYKLEEDIKTKDKVQRAGHREKILA
ncbi:DEAD/DEAH box helicase, partial [Candidatus Pacearchaeota archaeon]|nr:DEAD/DEAH box helicase [Candidatus Pacearchaeota archaeon]